MLGVFVADIHLSRTWTSGSVESVNGVRHESGGRNGVRTYANSPLPEKNLPRGGSNPQRCIKLDSEPSTLPTSYFGPLIRVKFHRSHCLFKSSSYRLALKTNIQRNYTNNGSFRHVLFWAFFDLFSKHFKKSKCRPIHLELLKLETPFYHELHPPSPPPPPPSLSLSSILPPQCLSSGLSNLQGLNSPVTSLFCFLSSPEFFSRLDSLHASGSFVFQVLPSSTVWWLSLHKRPRS